MMIGRSERMKEYMSANGDMNATIVEYVNGMEVIRSFVFCFFTVYEH